MAVTRLTTFTEKPKRGELYYVYPQSAYDNDDSEVGTNRTDVKNGRPAIVIGNDGGNATSGLSVIAWLTRQDKAPLPEHLTITSGPSKDSTVLLEHPITVSQSRFGDRICTMPTSFMYQVDAAILVSMGICDSIALAERMLKKAAPTPEIKDLTPQLNDAHRVIAELTGKIEERDREIKTLKEAPKEENSDLIKALSSERDFLRVLVKDMCNRLTK